MSSEILVVDDERTLLVSLQKMLTGAGYAVRTASNGETAVAAVRDRPPDLVLLDVMMPGLNGLEVCRQLRANDSRLPIVFLTALETSDDELKGLASGADAYIAKSVPDEVLLARIAALLRLRKTDEAEDGDFDFGLWRVEASKQRMVRSSGRAQALTEREVAFLRLLANRPGAVFDRDAILTHIWGQAADATDTAVSCFVYALRQKLGSAAKNLANVRGIGFFYHPDA